MLVEEKLAKVAGEMNFGWRIPKYHLTQVDPKTKKELVSGLFESEFAIVREMNHKADEAVEELVYSRGLTQETLDKVVAGKVGPYLGGVIKDGTARRFDPTCSDYHGFVVGLRYFAKSKMPEAVFKLWLNLHGISEEEFNQITPERMKDDYSVRSHYRRVLRESAPSPAAAPSRAPAPAGGSPAG